MNPTTANFAEFFRYEGLKMSNAPVAGSIYEQSRQFRENFWNQLDPMCNCMGNDLPRSSPPVWKISQKTTPLMVFALFQEIQQKSNGCKNCWSNIQDLQQMGMDSCCCPCWLWKWVGKYYLIFLCLRWKRKQTFWLTTSFFISFYFSSFIIVAHLLDSFFLFERAGDINGQKICWWQRKWLSDFCRYYSWLWNPRAMALCQNLVKMMVLPQI